MFMHNQLQAKVKFKDINLPQIFMSNQFKPVKPLVIGRLKIRILSIVYQD